MKQIDRDPSYFETPFKIQEAVSKVDIGDEFFLSDIAPDVPYTKTARNVHARAMQCLTETGVKGLFSQPQFRKISDPRLLIEAVFATAGDKPSAWVLRQKLPQAPDNCLDCKKPYNVCLILLAYQREVGQKIKALEKDLSVSA